MGGGRSLLLLFAFLHPSSLEPPGAEGASSSSEFYETAYACEESQLNITCDVGLHLNVIRANYGRFSIAICNLHGNTDWSVNCMSPRTLRVIRARCQGGSSCHVPVDSTIFGDPCPGTYKYVEVHYSCEREITSSTTARPRPPWFPEPPPDSWQSEFSKQANGANQTSSTGQTDEIYPTSRMELTTVSVDEDDQDTEDIEDESTSAEIDKPKVIKVKVPKPLEDPNADQRPNLRIPVIPKESSNLPEKPRLAVSHPKAQPTQSNYGDVGKMLNLTGNYCPPTNARNLYWNWTAAGDTAVLQCPSDSTGFAKWRCGLKSESTRVEWATHSPTLAECQSKWLNNLDSRLRDGEAISSVSGELAQLSGLQAMYGGDLQLSSRMLKHMAERMHYDIQGALNPEDKETMVTELVQNVVQTGSNILARVNHMSWADLSQDDVAAAATSLMVGLEENAFLLADAVTTEKIIIKPTTNILLSIRVMQARSTGTQRFPSVENLEMWDGQEDEIELSSAALQENSENGAVRIIFASYNEFDQLLVPSQRVNASLRFVNSKVISASLGKGRHIQLPDSVKITLAHLRTHNVSRPVCVFWDYAIQTWSNEGCRMIETNVTHTRCECDHLTNFALIMEEGESVGVVARALPTHITTIIACVATLLCVTLMMFAIVMTWRKFRVSHQCRSMLQKSGIPCFHKTKELSEKDKKQGNFYTVTPKLNGSVSGEAGKGEANIEMDNQQYFEHMIAMQKNQDSLVLNKTMSRRNTLQNNNLNEQQQQETNLNEVDLTKSSNVTEVNLNSHTLNNKKNFKAKTQCQHVIPGTGFTMGLHNEFVQQPKRSNASRAMSPLNHIYMEIDPKSEDGTVYEALNQSEAGSRSETYMLSSVSDMSDDDFRRCSDMSRQSSSRYAENKPLIRGGTGHFNMDRNLLTTINSVMHSQSVRVGNPQHHHRTSILSTISGLRYTDPSQPGQPSLPALPTIPAASYPEPPLQVTTTMNGDQFVCLNLNNPNNDQNGNPPPAYPLSSDQVGQTYASLSDTYVTSPEVQQQLQQQGGLAYLPSVSTMSSTLARTIGVVQAPVHSQLVVQRVGTLPRQFAHPLAPQ